MAQRYDFPAQTQVGNVGDPTNPQDVATLNYLNNNPNGFTLDTPPTYANASVASGNIVLTNPFTAGQVVNSFLVQTTNAAGTETSIAQFINARGLNQVWVLASAPTVTFTVTSTVTSTGQVALNLSASVTFPAIDRGTILQFQSVAPTFTPIRDLALGTNITGTVANNSQGRSTLTLNATGGSGGGGVSQIVAGNNISISPTTGVGIVTINSTGGGGTSGSAVDTGSVYLADNQALTVRVASNTPTSSTVAGSLATTVDFGSVNITSTPWPPFTIPAGFNTQFLMLEAADFSWSGVGLIQTTPTNALTQIAWIRKPSQAVGTTFAAARCWPVTASLGYSLVGTSTTDAQSRNPNSTLLFPELQTTQVSDTLGGNAARIITQPFVDSRISALVGSQAGATFLSPLTSAIMVRQGTGNVQVVLDTLVDSSVLAAQLNALGTAASFIGTTNSNAPDLQLSSWASEGVGNITLIANLVSTITLAQAQTFFAGTTSNQAYYGANAQAGNYQFRVDPQVAIDARVFNWGQNNLLATTPGLSKSFNAANQTVTLTNSGVISLNAVTGAVNLVQGTGIGISATGQNITITNTGSGGGIASSNFTTFINDLGQSLGATGFVSFISSLDQNIWVGLGMDSEDSDANDGGFIGNQKVLGTRQGTATTTYGFGALFPFAATYADLQVEILIPAMVITFTSLSSTGWDLEVYFSKASSTAASDPGRNANLFPAFRSGLSDLVSFNTLRSSQVVFAPVAGQANTFTATISGGGLYSAIANNYVHTDILNEYLPWIRLDGPAVTSIVSVVITQSESNAGNSGGYRALASLPGVGGATPTLDQVLQTGNSSARNLTLTGTAVLSAPNLTLNNAGTNTITLRTPAAVSTSYSLTLPAANPNYGTTLITTDAAGNSAWLPAGLELIRLISTVNITPNGAQTVDGVAVALNDLVLLQNQTTATQNGIYAVVLTGAWMKLTSYPSQSVFAQAGTANINKTYTRNQTAAPEQWILTSGTGTVPNLQQVLNAGPTANNLPLTLTGTGVLSAPTVAITNAANNSISLNVPAASFTNYTLTLPKSAPALGNTLVTTDTTGGLSWAPAGLEFIRVVALNNTTLTGPATIDGVVLATNDGVLAQNQTDTSQNGLYLANTAGAWVRVTTYVSQSVYVQNGTVAAGRTYTRSGNIGFEQWVLTSGTASVGGVPNGSYLYNNNGTIAGDTALTRDTVNNTVNAAQPIGPNNVARLADVQAASIGIKPVDPQGVIVNIAETNVVGTYTNNTGPGTATFAVTALPLVVAGRTVLNNEYVVLVGQTAQLQNGGYRVSSTGYSMTWTFDGSAVPQQLASVTFTVDNILGGSANFVITLPAGEPFSTAIVPRPSTLDPRWGWTTTSGSITVYSLITTPRWTTAPTSTTVVSPGVTWTGTPPNLDVFTATAPFTLTRVPSAPATGEYWASTATGATNYGVSYALTTLPPITTGTTALVYNIFLAAPTVPTLDQVTGAGANSTRAITLQPTDGYSLGLSGSTNTGTPAITLTSAGATDVVNLDITTKGRRSSVNFISTAGTALRIKPQSSGNNYHMIENGSVEMRISDTSSAGFTLGNLTDDGTVAERFCAINIRSVQRELSPATNAALRLRALGHPLQSPNVDLQLEPGDSGKLGLGIEGSATTPSGGVYIGQPNLTAFTTPLFLANDFTSPTEFSSGSPGQVLTSRGSGTPCWVTPSATGLAIYSYALSGDQTSTSTPLTFNTTASFSQGTSFGSWLTNSLFTFTSAGIYLAVFSFNVTGGSADISLVFNGNRIAGATGSGKQEVTGFGRITVITQTFQIQNFASTSFSAGQSNLTLLKLA